MRTVEQVNIRQKMRKFGMKSEDWKEKKDSINKENKGERNDMTDWIKKKYWRKKGKSLEFRGMNFVEATI